MAPARWVGVAPVSRSDLHGADHPSRVGEIEDVAGVRIVAAQLVDQVVHRSGFELGAQFGIGGSGVDRVDQGPEVEAGAPDEDRRATGGGETVEHVDAGWPGSRRR